MNKKYQAQQKLKNEMKLDKFKNQYTKDDFLKLLNNKNYLKKNIIYPLINNGRLFKIVEITSTGNLKVYSAYENSKNDKGSVYYDHEGETYKLQLTNSIKKYESVWVGFSGQKYGRGACILVNVSKDKYVYFDDQMAYSFSLKGETVKYVLSAVGNSAVIYSMIITDKRSYNPANKSYINEPYLEKIDFKKIDTDDLNKITSIFYIDKSKSNPMKVKNL